MYLLSLMFNRPKYFVLIYESIKYCLQVSGCVWHLGTNIPGKTFAHQITKQHTDSIDSRKIIGKRLGEDYW